LCCGCHFCRATPSNCLPNVVRTICYQVIHMGSCRAVTRPIYLIFPGRNWENSMPTITILQMHGMLSVKRCCHHHHIHLIKTCWLAQHITTVGSEYLYLSIVHLAYRWVIIISIIFVFELLYLSVCSHSAKNTTKVIGTVKVDYSLQLV